MTKQINWRAILILCIVAILSACNGNREILPQSPDDSHYGQISLAFGSTTRATTTTISPEEAKNFFITVSQESETDEGETTTTVIRGPQTLGTMSMSFPAGGGYSVYAESCTEAEAEANNYNWGQKRFVGSSEVFRINRGETTKVSVGMSVDNASLCVIIDPSLSNYFKTSCTIALAESDRGIVWTYDNAGKIENGVTTDGQVAYFNLNEDGTREIKYVIIATSADKTIQKEGTVTLKRAKNSRLNLAYDSGFFNLTIDVNENDLYISENLNVGNNDIIKDDGETNVAGENEEFNSDNTGVDYDQYN